MPQVLPLAARPAPFPLDPARAAIIVVDMQNDFGSVGGMFDRAGIDISGIGATVAPTARVLAAARQAGMAVVYLQMQHRGDLSDMGRPGTAHHDRHQRLGVGQPVTTPDGQPSLTLIVDTWGTRIVAGLAPNSGDIVVPKHRFSGFFETPLHSILQTRGVQQLVFTGCTTSICVESTLRDAMFRDYACVLLEDCCAEPIGQDNARSNHDASLLTVEVLLGWVSNSDHFLAATAG